MLGSISTIKNGLVGVLSFCRRLINDIIDTSILFLTSVTRCYRARIGHINS